MADTTPPNSADSGLEVRTDFLRRRQTLLARADCGDLFVDYYLHLGAHRIKVAPAMKQDPDGLFGGEPKIEIRCPRCAGRHAITREALEAFVAGMVPGTGPGAAA